MFGQRLFEMFKTCEQHFSPCFHLQTLAHANLERFSPALSLRKRELLQSDNSPRRGFPRQSFPRCLHVFFPLLRPGRLRPKVRGCTCRQAIVDFQKMRQGHRCFLSCRRWHVSSRHFSLARRHAQGFRSANSSKHNSHVYNNLGSSFQVHLAESLVVMTTLIVCGH